MSEAAARPLHVLSTAPTKTLFSLLGDPRVRYADEPAAGMAAPDVLVVPVHGSEIPFDSLIAQAAPEIWRRVATGETLLVFDNATEGHAYKPVRSERLHRFLAEQQIPARNAVFVTQDRNHQAAYEAWAARAGHAQVHGVLNYDYFIKNLLLPYEADGAETFARRMAAFERRSATRPRRFISLNFTPRPIKALFLLNLIADGLWDRGFVSFGGFPPEGSGKATQPSVVLDRLRAMALTGPLTEAQEAAFAALAAKPPQYLSRYQKRVAKGGKRKTPVFDEDVPEHDQSWFTVVTETEMSGPWRVTEKPMKSLLGLHPTIILGNAGSLELLRGFGFRTFDGYFDEAYDLESAPGRRFQSVWDEVTRLARTGEAELRRLEAAFADTLVHNAEWGLTRLPAVYRDQIDPAFVDALVARLAGNAATAT